MNDEQKADKIIEFIKEGWSGRMAASKIGVTEYKFNRFLKCYPELKRVHEEDKLARSKRKKGGWG